MTDPPISSGDDIGSTHTPWVATFVGFHVWLFSEIVADFFKNL